jgi:pSer/pThr/pTyr-binding forkhead associated (FHA) protein
LLPLTTIGRTPKNTVSIDDPYLSGEHAEIVRESGAWWVRDKGSTNGTLLNGVAVGGRTAIRAGDIVQFGGIRLQLLAGVEARR